MATVGSLLRLRNADTSSWSSTRSDSASEAGYVNRGSGVERDAWDGHTLGTLPYIVADNEGHGFSNADNRMALYHSMETFFGECLGGRVQKNVPDAIRTKVAELTVDVDDVTVAVVEEEGR